MGKLISLEGTLKWSKVFEHNREMEGYEGRAKEFNGIYEVTIGLDDEQFGILQESGCTKEGKVEDGLTWVTFERKHEMYRKKDNTLIEEWTGAPSVKDGTGETDENGKYPEWVSTEEEPRLIGNGSKGIVVVDITVDPRKKSIVYSRLEQVLVTELVEYEGGSIDDKLPF